jgi:microcystin degradation protein MlrC
MKMFIAGIATETNTFLPFPTGEAGFAAALALGRQGSKAPNATFNAPLIEWRRLAEAEGHLVVESFFAAAHPSGITVRAVYERIRDAILTDLQAALPVDLVLLNLHGAMVADGYDDCEGDVLARVRRLVGADAIIGAELDLHCHTTEKMFANANCLVAYKEYPHTDIALRAIDLYRVCIAAARRDVWPVTGAYDCRMINMWRTQVEPMKGFVARMQQLEGRDGVLSVSFGHGFPWGDVPDVGAKVWVVTDGDKPKAEALAAELGREIWELRDRTPIAALSVDAAIDRALTAPKGPVVIADLADNPGGGAPGDNTAMLRRLVEREIGDVALGYLWDPLAIDICRSAGIGARFELRIGGKTGRVSGDPIDLEVTVTAIADDLYQAGLGGGRAKLGNAVAIRIAPGIDVALVSDRCQVFSPDGFTGLGIDPSKKRIIVVKSTNHFYAGFAPIAGDILYAVAPTAMPSDFAAIPYRKFKRPYWPRVDDPFDERASQG